MDERQCFLDKIKNQEVNYKKTIDLTYSIISTYIANLNLYYLETPFRILGKTLDDAIKMALSDNNYNAFLDYCELILTVIEKQYYNSSYNQKENDQVYDIIITTLTKLSVVAAFNEEKKVFVCRKKDLKAEIVASNQPSTVKQKIYEYLSIRNGKKDLKRQVLKSIIDDVDSFCKRKFNIDEIKKTKQFYQCVRHPLDDPVKAFPFYYMNEEEWLDYIFQMVIDVLSIEDLEKRVKEIIKNEKEVTK